MPEDDTIYDEDGDEQILTNTQTFRRHMLRGNRKIHKRIDKQDEKIAEHDVLFDGDTRSTPKKEGVLRSVDDLKSREKTKDKILGLVGISALSALCLGVWEYFKTKLGAK